MKTMKIFFLILLVAVAVACSGFESDEAEAETCKTCHAGDHVAIAAYGDRTFVHDLDSSGVFADADCLVCHPNSDMDGKFELDVDLAQGSTAYAKSLDLCLACHDSDGFAGVTPANDECLVCHALTSELAAVYDGTHAHDVNGDNTLSAADCAVCHASTDMNGVFELNADLTKSGSNYSSVSSFCLACHDSNGMNGVYPVDIASSFSFDYHGGRFNSSLTETQLRGSYVAGVSIACSSCHMTHSSENDNLIIEIAGDANTNDASVANIAVATNGDATIQLCAVCHEKTDGLDSGNGLKTYTHGYSATVNCSNCHRHGTGTKYGTF